MTNARKFAFATMVAAVAVLGACRDERPDKGTPTAPKLVSGASANTLGGCTTPFKLDSLASLVFGSGSPNVNAVIGKIDNLRKKVETGNLVDAQAQANNIVDFVKAKAADGRLAGTQAQIAAFISGVLCYGGLSPDTFLIQPTDQPQIIASTEGTSGVSLQGNTVDVPTLLTLTTLSPTGPSPLITKLDQYPSYVSITTSSTLTKSAIVSVCPTGNIPAAVLARLRLGHQAAAGFELTPPADGSFLPCGTPASLASTSLLPGWLRTVASIFIPKPLYAMLREEADRGVGGLATEFSPFGAVDPELEFDRGGVGGLATEFKKTGTTPPAIGPVAKAPVNSGSATAAAPTLSNPGVSTAPGVGPAFDVVDPCLTATVNTEVTAGCRPSVIIRTHNGTTMQGVQVDWAIDLGGGKIAALDALVCGTLDKTSFSTITDADGKTGSCWQVGPNGGTNTVKAIPKAGTAGSDAPLGVRFFADPTKTGLIFTVEGLKIVTSITLSALSQPYDGSPKSVTATTSPAGISGVSITYDGASVQPTAAGSYAVVATLSNSQYQAPDATGTFTITKAPQAVLTINGPVAAIFGQTVQLTTSGGTTGAAPTFAVTASTDACTVTTAGLVEVTHGTGTCAVTATMAGNGNYESVTSAPMTIIVSKAQGSVSVTGPASLVYNTTGGIAPSVTGDGSITIGVTGPCTVLGTTVTMNSGTGSCTAQATLGEGANYLGSVSNVLTIAATKAAGSISITGPASLAYTTSGTITPTITGDGAVTYAASAPCSISGTTVTMTSGTGSCTVTATLGDGTNYAGAASNTLTIQAAKAPGSISITGPSTLTYNTSGGITPTLTGDGAVTYGLTGPCTITGTTVTMTSGTGSCTVTATLGDGTNYAGTTSNTLTIQAAKAPGSISITGPSTLTYNTSGGITPTLTGDGAVTYGLTGPCTISGTTVTMNSGTGSCTVTATLGDGTNYAGTSSAPLTIAATKAAGSISITGPSTLTYNTSGGITPTLTGDGAVTYGLTGPCAIAGTTVTMTSGTGSCTVTATLGAGTNFSGNSSNTVTIAAVKAGATLTLAPASLSWQYDGTPKIVTVTTAPPGLATVSITYNGSPTAPTAAGTYPVVATLANADYSGSATGSLLIAAASSATLVTCPTSVLYTGSAQTPCSAGVTGTGGLNQSLPVTYASNVVGTATASAVYLGALNWTPSSDSKTFKILYVQTGCFSSPVYNVMPDSKSAQRKGSNLPIKCTLTTASGAPVTNATGDIQIMDAGTTASNPPIRTGNIVLTLANVFKYSTSGNYAYGLDTSGLIAGHYYYAIAKWSDGSTSEGWFLLK